MNIIDLSEALSLLYKLGDGSDALTVGPVISHPDDILQDVNKKSTSEMHSSWHGLQRGYQNRCHWGTVKCRFYGSEPWSSWYAYIRTINGQHREH